MFGTVRQHSTLTSLPFYETINMYRMTGDNNWNLTERLFSFTAASPAITPTFTSNGNFTNLQYTIEMDGTRVGESVTEVTIPASHSDLFGVV